jgi:hypothetical protein
LDLKDAYLHVPVHVSSQKWLRFAVEGKTYQFRVLPFGLATAPRTFTRLVKVVAECLRRRGRSIYVYLDDWLLVAPSFQLLQSFIEEVLGMVSSLGFIVNLNKSSLEPSQFPQFLGARLDFETAMVRPSEERVAAVKACANLIMDRPAVTARVWMRLLGLMASLIGMVPFCRLQMREFQIHLLRHYRHWSHPLSGSCCSTSYKWLVPL